MIVRPFVCLGLAGTLLLMSAVSTGAVRTGAAPAGAGYVGEEQQVIASRDDTLADIAELYGLGFTEIQQANPGIDPWLPPDGQVVILPNRHLLPPGPREGILINLSEYRLYWFPGQEGKAIQTFPIGIGTVEFPTPEIDTRVVTRLTNPAWYPPASIRARHLEEEGEVMPLVIPPGPDNPLGPFALKLEAAGYLIHGTNKKMGIGMAVSHGCIRMYNQDIESLLHQVANDTPVAIMRAPAKAAIIDDQLWAEYHPDEEVALSEVASQLTEQLRRLTQNGRGWVIDQSAIRQVLRTGSGRPVLIGNRAAAETKTAAR